MVVCCSGSLSQTAVVALVLTAGTASAFVQPSRGSGSTQVKLARRACRPATAAKMTAADAHNNNAQRLPQAEPQPAPAVYLNGDEPIQLPEIVAPELSMTAEERVVLWEEICASEPRLQLAIEEQDFGTAEQLRNRITALKAQDPYFALREAIDSALAREDYYSAAKFKLQLDKLGPPQTILESVANGSRRVDMSPTINQAVSAAQQSAAAAAAPPARLVYTCRDASCCGARN
eukprot:TRINITY_DN6060_c0_g1_i2.p1 TRINITY_DN6060_c0_g1~~TRINITY_DN6060_c0_g1_i2.p1  ORF type:complete len:233 (-),score=41.07 TRINITY_DN6060_c0_g1_i2:52-750(-)